MGDRFRGTFSCPLLEALPRTVTDPSLSVTISDGAFDVQITALTL